jgi:hypothetical protein
VAPKHPNGDTTTPISSIQQAYKNVVVLREFLPIEEVVRSLSGCTLNIFWYQHIAGDDNAGQSGSVLMGVAARRPMIVSRHRKLAHVAAYEDEIYVADTEEQVYELASEIVSRLKEGLPVKRPERIVDDMSWTGAGEKYRKLIRTVANDSVKDDEGVGLQGVGGRG